MNKLIAPLLFVILSASVAHAQEAVPPLTPAALPTPRLPIVGIGLNVGVPDAAGADLVVRPWRRLRFNAGGTYNAISAGVRAGATFLPFGWGPSLTAEGGHYFDGNANALFHTNKPVLNAVGYSYADLHAGLDFGMRRFVFFIHGGMSYVVGSIHDLNQQFNGQATFTSDPTVRAWLPSAKLGFVLFIK